MDTQTKPLAKTKTSKRSFPVVAEATREITLHLSAELVQRLEQAASETHRPAESIAAEILGTALPPLRTRLPISPEELTEKFRDTPESELQKMTQRWFPEDKSKRIQELTELSGEQALSETQAAELEDLLDQVVINAAEGAAARLLLKQAGMK